MLVGELCHCTNTKKQIKKAKKKNKKTPMINKTNKKTPMIKAYFLQTNKNRK
jgi:hypothetical protein